MRPISRRISTAVAGLPRRRRFTLERRAQNLRKRSRCERTTALIAFAVRTALSAIPAFVSPLWIILGFTISVGVGLFFGYYPANRAANLDPIVCLRYE
jgi:ABC-type lipoprotein release transport system permease subunit